MHAESAGAPSGDERKELDRRAHRAVDQLTRSLPEDTMARALAAETDYEALVTAILASGPELPGSRNPRDRALLRGLRERQRLMEARGGPLGASEVGRLLGISRQAVHQRWKAGKLLGLDTGRHGLAYPAWQFGPEGVVPDLAEVLAILEGWDPWAQARFLLNPNPRLDNSAPLDALKEGRTETVLEAARAFGEHGGA